MFLDKIKLEASIFVYCSSAGAHCNFLMEDPVAGLMDMAKAQFAATCAST